MHLLFQITVGKLLVENKLWSKFRQCTDLPNIVFQCCLNNRLYISQLNTNWFTTYQEQPQNAESGITVFLMWISPFPIIWEGTCIGWNEIDRPKWRNLCDNWWDHPPVTVCAGFYTDSYLIFDVFCTGCGALRWCNLCDTSCLRFELLMWGRTQTHWCSNQQHDFKTVNRQFFSLVYI